MVEMDRQIGAVLRTFLDESEMPEICAYSVGMSFQMERDHEKYRVIPYNENRLDFVKKFYHFEIENVCQKFTWKKIARMAIKIMEGNEVFIRWYEDCAETIDDFEYVQVQKIDVRRFGLSKLTLSNGIQVSQWRLQRKMKVKFQKLSNWMIYEDIYFKIPVVEKEESSQQFYINRMYKRMRCVVKGKQNVLFQDENKMHISERFIQQREDVYSILKNNANYTKECKKNLNLCLHTYKQKEISFDELKKCLISEYQVLEALVVKKL